MIIQQIRNATVKITMGGAVFLVDPWFQGRGEGPAVKTIPPALQGVRSPLEDLPESPQKTLRDVDACLVTHLHFDHFCAEHLPGDIPLLAQNAQDAKALSEMGFEQVRAFEGESMIMKGVTIHKTKAVHGDRKEVIQKMGEACGFCLEAPGEKRLYLAGDTVYCEEVEKVIDSFQPEVIVLNCCEAAIPLGRLIMNLEDLEKVCKRAPEALVIASHLGSVNHALLTREDVRRFCREKGLERVLVPEAGEKITQ